MRKINEIASWYKNNNQLCDESMRINILSLYTVVAYKIKGLDIEYEEISYTNNSFNIGINNLDEEADFTDEELRVLNTINRLYGYLKVSTLLYKISVEEPTIKNVYSVLNEEIKEDLENYQDYDFNEYVIISNNNTFFISNDTVLTDEEKNKLSKYNDINQNQFTVFRDTNNDKLVIY